MEDFKNSKLGVEENFPCITTESLEDVINATQHQHKILKRASPYMLHRKSRLSLKIKSLSFQGTLYLIRKYCVSLSKVAAIQAYSQGVVQEVERMVIRKIRSVQLKHCKMVNQFINFPQYFLSVIP